MAEDRRAVLTFPVSHSLDANQTLGVIEYAKRTANERLAEFKLQTKGAPQVEAIRKPAFGDMEIDLSWIVVEADRG